jgi:hypothetical protein
MRGGVERSGVERRGMERSGEGEGEETSWMVNTCA